jgi:DNA-binding NtrC family response regulator
LREEIPVIVFNPPNDERFVRCVGGDVSVTIDGQLQRIIDELVSKGIPLEAAKREFEKKYVAAAVTRASGNMGRAARSLGIHRNTLRAKISLLKVKPPLRGRDNS